MMYCHLEICFKNINFLGLESLLSGQKLWLLLQRALVNSQHSHGGSEPYVTQVPGYLSPSSGLYGHCTHMVCRLIYMQSTLLTETSKLTLLYNPSKFTLILVAFCRTLRVLLHGKSFVLNFFLARFTD